MEDTNARDTVMLGKETEKIVLDHDISISEMNLSKRSYNALITNNIYTVNKLITMSRDDLLRIEHLGSVSADEILKKCKNYITKEEKEKLDFKQEKIRQKRKK